MPAQLSIVKSEPLTPVAPQGLSIVKSEPTPDFKTTNAVDANGGPVVLGAPEGALSRFGSNWARNALPSTTPSDYIEGPLYAAKHPIDSAGLILQAIAEAHKQQAQKTLKSFQRIVHERGLTNKLGALSETVGHAAATIVPVLGPAAANAGEQLAEGDIAGGLGSMTGLLTPAALAELKVQVVPRSAAPVNPAEASALAFAAREGIPVDAGTASGNRFVKSVQGLVDHSPIGSMVAERAKVRTGDALASTGQRLAEQANPGGGAVGAVEAGEAVRSNLTKQIQDAHAEATTAYETLRAFEQNATPDMVRARNTGAGAADFNDMQLAVDLRQEKQALQPILSRLLKKKELTGSLMGAEGRAAVALDALVTGPDFAPLSVVDAALGDIKAMARGADMPELRTTGQGIAAEVVKKLDRRVRARAAQAGPEVLAALESGRDATTRKYAKAEALDLIAASDEPRGVFNRLTANGDAGLTKLRELQTHAPDEVPTVGRALLENLLDKPTSEGGFKFADKALSDWRRIGPETKKILFTPDHIAALNDFFLIAKRLGESPNPSQSGLVLNAAGQLALAFTHPVTGVPVILGSAAMSAVMHSPQALRILNGGLRALSQFPRASKVAAVQLAKATRLRPTAAGVPAAAGQPDGDEHAFRAWYAQMAKTHDLSPDPDAPAQFYDYRAAFKAGAKPDASRHWPSTFKKPGHPNEIVGGFNTRTGEPEPGYQQETDVKKLISMGWDAATAAQLVKKARR